MAEPAGLSQAWQFIWPPLIAAAIGAVVTLLVFVWNRKLSWQLSYDANARTTAERASEALSAERAQLLENWKPLVDGLRTEVRDLRTACADLTKRADECDRQNREIERRAALANQRAARCDRRCTLLTNRIKTLETAAQGG